MSCGYNFSTNKYFRLEAATSRLEDLTVYQAEALKAISGNPAATSTSTQTPKAVPAAAPKQQTFNAAPPAPAAPSAPPAPPAPSTPAAPPAPTAAPIPKSVVEYDSFIKESAVPFFNLSNEIGEPVSKQAQDIKQALSKTRDLLLIASESKKPADNNPALADFYKTIIGPLQAAVAVKESKESRTSKLYNHIATLADGVSAFSWFSVPTPAPFIGEFKDSAQFFANKVLKEFRGVDQKHVDWVQSFLNLLVKLQAYVKEYQTTGPAWNNQGKDFSEVVNNFKKSDSSAKSAPPPAPGAPSAGGPPPPPPPPPSAADLMKEGPSQSSGGSSGMGAVFSQLNQGEGITSKLKKVDKSQMTHKNPELRKSSTVQGGSKPAPPKKPASLLQKKQPQAAKRPPRKELVDNKWFIENIEDDSSIVIEAELSHAVFIDRCANSTIQIKGKANAITLNSCTGCGVLLDTLVSGVDVIKCKKFGIQVTGKVHTISIDQSDGGQIYLSKESIDMEIYTSQSTGLNIEVPKEEAGDFEEVAVPEQLLHKIGPDGKLVSTIVEHAG